MTCRKPLTVCMPTAKTVLERRIQEEEAAEVSSMVRTANVTPEQLAALLRQSANTTPNPAALAAVGVSFEKEENEDEV